MALFGKDKKQSEKPGWLEKLFSKAKTDNENNENNENNAEVVEGKKQNKRFVKEGNYLQIVEGLHFFHGPVKLKMFGRELIISNVRQVGFISLFLAFVVMIFAILSTVFQLNDALDKGNKLLVKQNIISLVILGIITLIVVYFLVKMIVTVFKNSTKIQKVKEKTDSTTDFNTEKELFCAYCGAKIWEGETVCPRCGSKQLFSKNSK